MIDLLDSEIWGPGKRRDGNEELALLAVTVTSRESSGTKAGYAYPMSDIKTLAQDLEAE